METIIPIKGKVKFSITLDAGVWIFDDRRIDLEEFFQSNNMPEDNEDDRYTESMAKFWEKEIREGAVFPPTIKSEKKYEKEKVLTGSFAMPLEPLLKNAEPEKGASFLVIETKSGEHIFPLSEANSLMMAFSDKGKPFKETGPVHILLKNGSNRENPIQHVQAIRID